MMDQFKLKKNYFVETGRKIVFLRASSQYFFFLVSNKLSCNLLCFKI